MTEPPTDPPAEKTTGSATQPPTEPATNTIGPTLHDFRIGGRTFAYEATGAGPELVLINGYGGTSSGWDPFFVDALATRFRVICPDNRGMGRSDLGDPGDCDIASMAADVAALVHRLGVPSAAVAGWSMGGFIAQQLAIDHPDLVSSLILLATDHGGPDATAAAPAVWERMTDRSGTPRERASRLISTLFPPTAAGEIDRLFGDQVALVGATLSPVSLAAQERAVDRWHTDPPSALPASTPPVLAIGGTEDAVMPPANQAALASRWPGCRLVSVAGGGHAFMAQQPALVARLIIDHLGARSEATMERQRAAHPDQQQ